MLTKKIRERVRRCREQRGLTQKQLAGQVGICQPTYCNFESKGRPLGVMTAVRLHEAFGGEVKCWEVVSSESERAARDLAGKLGLP